MPCCFEFLIVIRLIMDASAFHMCRRRNEISLFTMICYLCTRSQLKVLLRHEQQSSRAQICLRFVPTPFYERPLYFNHAQADIFVLIAAFWVCLWHLLRHEKISSRQTSFNVLFKRVRRTRIGGMYQPSCNSQVIIIINANLCCLYHVQN